MLTRVAAAWMVLCSIAFFPIELPTGAGKLIASSLGVAMAQEPAQQEAPEQDVPAQDVPEQAVPVAPEATEPAPVQEAAPAPAPQRQRGQGKSPFDFLLKKRAAQPQPQAPAAQVPAPEVQPVPQATPPAAQTVPQAQATQMPLAEVQPAVAKELSAPVAPPTPQYAPMVPAPQTTAPAAPPATPSAVQPAPQAQMPQMPAPAMQPPVKVAPPAVPPAMQSQPVQPRPQLAAPQPTRPAMRRGDVSFNFDDADIYSVIQTVFGDILKSNYIIDPAVKGRVTFRSVEPVTRESVLPLLEVILRLNGIGIVEEGGLYRIVPISDVPREPAPVGIGREAEKVAVTGKALVQVVSVKYVQSSEMVRILTPFLSKTAVIIDVPKSNYIVIVDTDANVKRLLQIVEIFDSEQLKQVTPQVFVYPVQNGKAKDVAAILQQIFQGAKTAAKAPTPTAKPPVAGQPQPATAMPVTQPAAGQHGGEALVSEITRIIPDEITNSIIIMATPEDYALIYETIAKIDIVPRQVLIEGLLVRMDITDNMSFGFSWSLRTDVHMQPFQRDWNLGGDVAVKPTGTTFADGFSDGFTFIGKDPTGIVRARITAALKDSKGKIVSAPNVLVSDNREARIQVGSQIPIATSATVTPTTGTTVSQTSTIQYKDVGNILKVKPQVNDSGLVSLEITQENSQVSGTTKIADQDFTAIAKTEVTTTLVVQDGETIIIGGLIEESHTTGKEGIPFISKIPLLGSLFSSTTDNTTRTELILLLTPRVMRSQKESSKVTSEYTDRYKRATQDKQIDEFMSERGQKKQGNGERAPEDPNPELRK